MSEKQVTHTPGPWHAWYCKENETGGGIFQDTNTDSQRMICRMAKEKRVIHEDKRKSDDFVHSAEDQANARLIAAAPEMLKVLQEILEPCPVKGYLGKYDHRRTYKARKKARAILDRVEGETA